MINIREYPRLSLLGDRGRLFDSLDGRSPAIIGLLGLARSSEWPWRLESIGLQIGCLVTQDRTVFRF